MRPTPDHPREYDSETARLKELVNFVDRFVPTIGARTAVDPCAVLESLDENLPREILPSRAHAVREAFAAIARIAMASMILLAALGCTMTAVAGASEAARVRRLVERCDGDHARFSDVVLGDSGMWEKQLETLDSVRRFKTTLCVAGNSVGKSYMAGRLILSFLFQHRDSIVFTTGPSQGQLNKVVWGEVESAIAHSRIPLGIRPRGKGPVMLNLTDRWFAIGHVTNKLENSTGYHREHLLLLVDEGSGTTDAAFEAAWSLNPSKIVVFGNPLHPHGRFYDLVRNALEEKDKPDRTSNVVRIPSTSSPDIGVERSKRGLADKGFLDQARRDYGEGSIWWLSHVLAQFPDVTAETLIPATWADLAARAIRAHPPGHPNSGPARTSIDLAGGNGGDRTVILTRDDLGLLDLRMSNAWTLERAAIQARESASAFRVAAERVTFDRAGLGADFAARLTAVGLGGARDYLGGYGASNAANLRSAAARELRFRLDPDRMVMGPAGVPVKQPAFSLNPARPDWFAEIRPELVGALRFLDKLGRYQLELSEDMRDRMRRSPDILDALIQSFAYPG